MQTLALYDMIKSAFEHIIKESDTCTKAAYENALKDAETKVSEIARRLRCIDPILTPYTLPLLGETGVIDETEVPVLMESIKESSRKRHELGIVYSGASFTKVVQRTAMEFPQFVDFKAKPHVLICPYEDQGWEDFAVKMMNQILLGCLLTMPKGTVRINFINPSLSSKSSFLSSKLSSDLCRVFVDRKEIHEFMSLLVNRIKDVLKGDKTSVDNTIAHELVVLLDYPYQYDGITEDMRIVIERGQQAGIHFIVLNDLRQNFDNDRAFNILTLKDRFFQEPDAFYVAKKEDYDKYLCRIYQLCNQPALLNACLEYLNSDSNEKQAAELFEEADYKQVDEGLSVPVGQPVNRSTMDFCLGQDGHVHSFIIGRSGTGKSVLLHDIIIEAIHKYSPHDLQLYLLDCKLGGVEFNQYRDIKHARALLVDNSDIQIILEILRDLGEQMKERGKLLRDAGVTKIDDYNASNPDNRLSRIWVIIDECHVLFEQSSMSNRRLRGEIIEIITKVATEGRNQGVHLIMATQTLANADIPTSILNNITDRYALNCAPLDAEKMWSGCSKQNANLNVGDVLYHNTSGVFPETQFHATYFTKNEIEKRISSAVSKAADYASNGQFYFNGSQVFCFDEEIEDLLGNSKKQNLKACVGRSITLRQTPVLITLKQGISENILLTGLDDLEQTTRTAIDVLLSSVMSNAKNNLNYKIYVFDYKDDDSGQYQGILEYLECEGIISIVSKRQQGIFYKQLAEDIKNETAKPTILFILGQQRFRELNLNVEIEEKPAVNDAFGAMNFTSTKGGIKTYKDALSYILDNGPDLHVHTVLQVDKPSNLLFEDFVSRKFIFRKFRHLILLKSEQNVMTNLGLSDDIRLESLSSDNERLRAIYYADGDDGWTLFSPFAFPDESYLFTIKK